MAKQKINGNQIGTTGAIFTKEFVASGRCTNTTTGLDISVGSGSSMYEVFTFAWAGSTTGKAGYALCTGIGGSWGYVDYIKNGPYSGEITFNGSTINIKAYNTDGCRYLILRTCTFQ